MESILEVLIAVGGLFLVIGFTADAIARAAVRRKVADKALSPEQIEAVLRRRTDPDHILKWALLATAVGIGFILIQFLPPDLHDQPIVIGLVLVFAGGALFLYRQLLRRGPDR